MAAVDRDARAVRSGLLVGLGVGAVSGAALALVGILGTAAGDRSSTVISAAMLLGLLAGAIAASAWLLVGAIRDLFAGRTPSRRRLVVTGLVSLLALTTPVLLAALAIAVGGQEAR